MRVDYKIILCFLSFNHFNKGRINSKGGVTVLFHCCRVARFVGQIYWLRGAKLFSDLWLIDTLKLLVLTETLLLLHLPC